MGGVPCEQGTNADDENSEFLKDINLVEAGK